MSKSTALKITLAIAIAAALLASMGAVTAAKSYAHCASRLIHGAPPSDASPPATFRRLAAAFWDKRDLYLARVLPQECAAEARGEIRRLGHGLFALGLVKTQLSSSEREILGAILLPAPGGCGLTRAAQAEWGRPPASLNESEMAWLFVVGQMPSCSKQRATAEPDRDACARIYQRLLAELPRLYP